jgi:hypothetical protein
MIEASFADFVRQKMQTCGQRLREVTASQHVAHNMLIHEGHMPA